jgi:hypothetical protein
MHHRWTAGCLVAFTVATSALIVPAGAVWSWLADGEPPRIAIPELVVDRTFDAAAWDEAEVTDERALWKVRVALDCGVERTERTGRDRVALREIVSGETLAAGLRPGQCTLLVEAWDRSLRWHPVQERRAWFVYAGGTVLPADGVHEDGAPPTITVKARSTVVRDELSGVASVVVRTRCGGSWTEARREVHAELAPRVELRPLLADLEGALPWSGSPGSCEGRIVASDHAGHETETHVRWYRYADAVVPEDELLGDIVPPMLEGSGDLSLLALTDASGLRSVSAELQCEGQPAQPLPTQEYLARVRRVPLVSLLPAHFPEGACRVRIKATDHAGRGAEHDLELFVGPDGHPRRAPPIGDRRPPRIVGPLRTWDDLLHASWFDEAPGVTTVVGRVRCGTEASIELVPRLLEEPTQRVGVLEGPPPLVRGRCVVSLAAVDGEDLTATTSMTLFVYADGTVVPADRLEEADAPELIGLEAALADGRLTAAEWSAAHVVDSGAGLAEVRVDFACRQAEAPVTRRLDGPVVDLSLSALVPDPGAVTSGRRCPIEIFAADHAGNVLVTETQRARFE